MADLTIAINGDCKKYEDALQKAQDKTEALNSKLQSLSLVAGAAFAVLTTEIFQSVKAFGESQVASNKLVQALQNQGLYSDELVESYKQQAAELQVLTGVDDDAIIKAQALLQGMTGTHKISKELTKAILDLSAAKGMDLESTTSLIGKGIEGHFIGLNKLGLSIDAHLNKEERTARIIEIVTQKFGGQAEAMNQGLGGLKGLHAAFSDLQESIGERFAPAIESCIKGLTKFFQVLNEHKIITELISVLILAGTVISGLSLSVGLGGMAWLKYKAMMEAAKVGTELMTLATRGLVGATGIGALVIVITELYLHWSTIWPFMKGVFQAFVNNISTLAGGVGKVLQGAFTLNVDKIKEGLDQAKGAIVSGYEDISKTTAAMKVKPPGMEQDSGKAEAAAIQDRKQIEAERLKNAILKAEMDLQVAKINDASQAVIKIKTDELETLKAMADEKNAHIKNQLQAHLNEMRAIDDLASAESLSKKEAFDSEILIKNQAYQSMSVSQQKLFVQQNHAALTQSLETEKTIKGAYALKQVQEDVRARNQFLMDEQQFGLAYATINQMMHSRIAQGTKSAFGEMAAMQNSQNSTLKSIGKAAAVANIIIKTGESAMNIFAGFSSIPFIGPALGAAAAAAAIAYGAEQVGNVLAANKGGVVTGGIPNVDSVRAILTPGELIVPAQNFDEVISAVSNQRSGAPGVNSESSDGGPLHIVLSLKDNLMDFIEVGLVERQRFNISLQGAR